MNQYAILVFCRSLMLSELKAAVKRLKRESTALYYASLDPATGCLPRLVIGVALAYLLSPLDLVPDFIPVLGFLDDLIVVPILIWLAMRLIPAEVMAAARERADAEEAHRAMLGGTCTVLGWPAAQRCLLGLGRTSRHRSGDRK